VRDPIAARSRGNPAFAHARVRRYPTGMTAPILVFDSGVGGLSVLAAIRARLPGTDIVYAADNAGFPYGTKTEAEIAMRVPALLGRLVERYRPAVAVIACNTASTIALDRVRAALDVPVIGTVPAIKPAAAMTRTQVIGVLGTAATVRQPYVDRLTAEFAGGCTVLRHGSARLVELAEAKLRGTAVELTDCARALAGLLDQPGGDRLDTVVLACTHFPLLGPELLAASPRPLTFVDSGDGIARRVATLLGAATVGTPALRAVFTRNDASVDALRPALHSRGIDGIDFL